MKRRFAFRRMGWFAVAVLCWAGLTMDGFSQVWYYVSGGSANGVNYNCAISINGSSTLPSECKVSGLDSGISGHVSIPSSIPWTFENRALSNRPTRTISLPVTAISSFGLSFNTGITGVTIPNSVTTIGNYAFENCTSLSSVTIPNSVTTIGDSAFYNCTSLSSVTIGNSVTTIGNYAFRDCSSLSSVTIPNSVTTIGNYAFENCTSLSSVTIPNSVTTIGNYAFENCTSLSSVTIGSGVTSWTYFAFSGSTNIANLTLVNGLGDLPSSIFSNKKIRNLVIPNSVTNIGGSAFSGNTLLTSVAIGTGVKEIGGGAFAYCTSLPDLVVPDNVISVGSGMINGSVGLETVSIGNGVTELPVNFFYGLTNLLSVSIGNSIQKLDTSAFSNCRRLQSVTLGSSIQEIGRLTFEKCNSLRSIVVPDSVKKISDSAFASCGSLQSVTFGSGLQEIERNAFSLCTSLTGLSFPSSLRVIGDHAFQSCRNLAEVQFQGSSLQSIGVGAFENCVSLNEAVLPASLSHVGYLAFATGAQRTDLYFKGNAPQNLAVSGAGTFSTRSGESHANLFGSGTPGILYCTPSATGFPAEGVDIQPGHPTVIWQDSEIDVLTIFDSAAAAWVDANAGGDLDLVAQGYMDKLNQALTASGAGDVRFRSAAAKADTEYEATDTTLRAPLAAVAASTKAKAWRNEASADLVTMVVGIEPPTPGPGETVTFTSGIGHRIESIAGDAEGGCFSVCVLTAVNEGHTLSHELGHNLGLIHPHAMGASASLIATYGAGWFFKGQDDYYTIMGYNHHGDKVYQPSGLFSTPVVMHKGGAAGDKDKGDAVRLIKQTAPVVAKYRTANTPVQLPAGLSAGEADVASQWILANPEWGTDFRHVSAKALMAGFLVNEKPRAFLDEDVEFGVAEARMDGDGVTLGVDMWVASAPKTGPLNARMDIESRVSLLPGASVNVATSYPAPAFVAGCFPAEAAATNSSVGFFYPVLRMP